MDTILIEKQLEKVSPIIKRVFFSIAVAEEIAGIGKRNGLLLDQIDSLIEETGYMVIGLKASKDFVTIIGNKLQIREGIARKIAGEINDTVLNDVKEEIRKLNEVEEAKIVISEKEAPTIEKPIVQVPIVTPIVEEPTVAKAPELVIPIPTPSPAPKPLEITVPPETTPIEKAGDFTIEKPAEAPATPLYKETNIDRDTLLKGIEDPEEIKPATQIPVPSVATPQVSMVDHLLTTPVNTAEKRVEVKAPVEIKAATEVKAPAETKKPYTADPYREPV